MRTTIYLGYLANTVLTVLAFTLSLKHYGASMETALNGVAILGLFILLLTALFKAEELLQRYETTEDELERLYAKLEKMKKG